MFIREVKFTDYLSVKKLVLKSNLTIYKKQDWINIWKKNPFFKKNKTNFVTGWVLEKNKRIVGHIGSIPTRYNYNLKSYNGSIISCWVVEPKYRLHSIRLVKEFISQKNRDFFIATSSNEKTVKTLKIFGWEKMPAVNYSNKLYIILKTENVVRSYIKKILFSNLVINKLSYYLVNIFLKKKINYWKNFKMKNKIVIYKEVNSDFNEMWEKLKIAQKNNFLFNRSREWLNWHLDNKLKKKKAFIAVKKTNNKITAYAICVIKKVKKLNLKKIVLVDLVSLEDNTQSYLDLILFSIKEGIKLKCDLFEIVGFNDKKRRILKIIKPFEIKSKFSPFFFKTNNLNLNKVLLKKKVWDPSEIDGDSIY